MRAAYFIPTILGTIALNYPRTCVLVPAPTLILRESVRRNDLKGFNGRTIQALALAYSGWRG